MRIDRRAILHEQIHLSARRMVAGLEVARREQANLGRFIIQLSKHDKFGDMAQFARDTGISRQLVSEVLSGRKKIGAVAARRIAKK